MIRFAAVGLLLGGLGGCADPLIDASYVGDPFFEISGAVEIDDLPDGTVLTGAVAWAWYQSTSSAGRLEMTPFVPDILRYSMDIHSPPISGGAQAVYGPPSDQLEPLFDVALLIGLPIILAGPEDESPQGDIDPQALLDWVSGAQEDASVVVTQSASSDHSLVAVTRDYLLMAMNSDRNLGRLDQHPGWASADSCGLGQVMEGLTLYRAGLGYCSPWQALALPGERTGFQGVTMGAPRP